MRWKICLVVTERNAKYLDSAIKYLNTQDLAEDGIHVVCGKDIQVPNLACVARSRAERKLNEAETWVLALETLSRTYSATEDLFLFMTPDLTFWDKFKFFCEHTVELPFVAVYLPFTPTRYFVESSFKSIPCDSKEAAWCETNIDEPSNASRCLLLSNSSCRLLATYLQDVLKKDPSIPTSIWDWPELFFQTVHTQYRVHCYAAVPSLARSKQSLPVDYICDFDQSRLDVRRGRYLN